MNLGEKSRILMQAKKHYTGKEIDRMEEYVCKYRQLSKEERVDAVLELIYLIDGLRFIK